MTLARFNFPPTNQDGVLDYPPQARTRTKQTTDKPKSVKLARFGFTCEIIKVFPGNTLETFRTTDIDD